MVHLSETNLDTLLEIIRRQSNEIDDLKGKLHQNRLAAKMIGHGDACGCDACFTERLINQHPTTARRVREEAAGEGPRYTLKPYPPDAPENKP